MHFTIGDHLDNNQEKTNNNNRLRTDQNRKYLLLRSVCNLIISVLQKPNTQSLTSK